MIRNEETTQLSDDPKHWPSVMTCNEVIAALRITGKAPFKALYRLRKNKGLKSFRRGNEVLFLREHVVDFLKRLCDLT